MRRDSLKIAGMLLALCAMGMVLAAAAQAVNGSESLVKVGSGGSGAGQVLRAAAVGTDPVDGHIFAVDAENDRVDEFTPWGNFVKAFGWDVAPGAVNEQQEVTIKATAGQFKLTFGASTTADLEHDASATAVQAALNGLASVSAAGGSVSVESGASDSASSRYVISFSGGPLAGVNVAQMTAANGTVPLSGGTPTTSAAVETRADGTPGGTGLESCTIESGCKAGTFGTGPGQFTFAGAISVDDSGNVYVRDTFELNLRVQKFDSAGRFVLMLGGKVNKTTNANVCTAASGNECGAGVSGVEPGAFSGGAGIAVGPTGRVFVSDRERIQEFESDGSVISSIPIPGKSVQRLAIDSVSGDFFTTLADPELEPNVHKFNPAGTELCSLPVPNPGFIATDSDGNLYAANVSGFIGTETILEFDGNCPATKVSEFNVEPPPVQKITALATNTAGDLLVGRSGGGVDFIQVYGPPPVKFEPPPAVSPTIGAQFLIAADDHSATVKAQINPNFWADTNYYVEYGTGKCSEAGCTLKQPASPALLGAGVIRKLVPTAGVVLPGLEPKKTYHYRFVAESGGGGPVKGVGGEVGLDGTEGAFTTPAPESVEAGCPNNSFRFGPAAKLPDCRAYEMVSPVAKENGDTLALINVSGFENRLNQTALNGESIAYSAYRAFPDSQAAPYTSQYIGRRGAGGWTSEGLAEARGGAGVFNEIAATENEFKAFSPDLCNAWLVFDAEPLLAPGAVEGFPNLYRRDGCPSPHSFEALTTVEPPPPFPPAFRPEATPELQGFSADGTKAVFRTPWKMTTDAAANGTYQVYEAGGGSLTLVCILPNGTPLGSDCSAGTGTADIFLNRGSSVSHAISADGSRIYWTAATAGDSAGKVYVRIDGTETKKVSETQSTLKAQFLGASADGASALFTVTEGPNKEKLYLYSLEAESSSEVAGEVMGVVGASEDLSYVYFVSRQSIGGKGTAGKPNLYLLHEGTKTFVATLSATDVRTPGGGDSGVFSDVSSQAVYHVAKATPDGRHLAFISTNPLTGFDNTDAESSEADSEVFRYDADSGEVNCASCSPVGARPAGRIVVTPGGASTWIAALIPGGENQLYTPRAQSDDGNRLFFTAYTPLVPRDTNGKADVYEWEAAGSGGCTEEKSAFSAINDGCVYLITTGESDEDSEFIDSTPDGSDVFFLTEESILGQDPGLIDLYDARAGGGFPAFQKPVPCDPSQGACQAPDLAPGFQPPVSTAPTEGNPPVKQQLKCPKGKHKVTKNGKARCVPNKKKKNAGKKSSKRAHKSGRAGK